MTELIDTIADALGYRFRTPELLQQALTHRSHYNESLDGEESHNERLEFLGDAVLGLCVSSLLMERLPEAREGDLTKLRAMVVSESSLSLCAADCGIGQFLRLGRGEDQSGGRSKPSILSDALEALLGAVFLDGGFGAVQPVVEGLLCGFVDKAVEGGLDRDHKTRLQEVAQHVYHVMPRYEVVDTRGPDHAKMFTVAVQVGPRELARGEGASKKVAEQAAARRALSVLEACIAAEKE